jgi:hypothetical protein
MVWVYNSPLTEKEQKAYEVLNSKTHDSSLAKNTVKIISLLDAVSNKTFKSPKEIENSFLFDKGGKPIFNKETSEKLFEQLKKRGGAPTNYPFTDYTARRELNNLANKLPGYIVGPIERIYSIITNPLTALKERIPTVDLAISAANSATETGISAVGDIAKTIGGPMGSLVAIPIMAIASSIAATTSMAQQDLGQSIVFLVTAIPFIGSIMVKLIDKIEKQVSKIKKYPHIAVYVPYVRDYINEQRQKQGLPPLQKLDPMAELNKAVQQNPFTQQLKNTIETNPFVQPTTPLENPFKQPIVPQTNPFKQSVVAETNPFKGGKRFSTRKHIRNKKWLKTRRIKSAKV